MKATRVGMVSVAWILVACMAPVTVTSAAMPSQEIVQPPPRPLDFTPDQARALEQLALQPQYAVDLDTRAAYTQDAQKQASEAGAVAVFVGYAGTIIGILIAAAPL